MKNKGKTEIMNKDKVLRFMKKHGKIENDDKLIKETRREFNESFKKSIVSAKEIRNSDMDRQDDIF